MRKIFYVSAISVLIFYSAKTCGSNFTPEKNKNITNIQAEASVISKERRGVEVTFRTAGGKDGMGFVVQAPSDAYLLVFHDQFGLNAQMKQEAERLRKELKMNVFVVDLYEGKIANTAEEAKTLMLSVKKERAEDIIKGAIASIGKEAEIYTLGRSFGGNWSLQAALLAGEQAMACVIFSGVPETDLSQLKKLNCEVLGIFNSTDEPVNTDNLKVFEKNVKEANKEITVKIFNEDLALAHTSNLNSDSGAKSEADKLVFAFLKKKME